MRKKVGIIKRMSCLLLIFLLSINSFAAIVSDNDGSAFITKAEFDALKSSFQAQIDTYNQSIDSKIDGAIASYLSGIQLSKETEIESCLNNYDGVLITDLITYRETLPHMQFKGSFNVIASYAPSKTASDYSGWASCKLNVTPLSSEKGYNIIGDYISSNHYTIDGVLEGFLEGSITQTLADYYNNWSDAPTTGTVYGGFVPYDWHSTTLTYNDIGDVFEEAFYSNPNASFFKATFSPGNQDLTVQSKTYKDKYLTTYYSKLVGPGWAYYKCNSSTGNISKIKDVLGNFTKGYGSIMSYNASKKYYLAPLFDTCGTNDGLFVCPANPSFCYVNSGWQPLHKNNYSSNFIFRKSDNRVSITEMISAIAKPSGGNYLGSINRMGSGHNLDRSSYQLTHVGDELFGTGRFFPVACRFTSSNFNYLYYNSDNLIGVDATNKTIINQTLYKAAMPLFCVQKSGTLKFPLTFDNTSCQYDVWCLSSPWTSNSFPTSKPASCIPTSMSTRTDGAIRISSGDTITLNIANPGMVWVLVKPLTRTAKNDKRILQLPIVGKLITED